MRVAICDDETEIIDILDRKLQSYFKSRKLDYDIRHYCDAKDLISDDLSKLEVLFLDVEMPNLNGMEAAKEIRKFNKSIKIIFVTAYSEFVFESFKVNAFRYLLKPLKDKELEETLDSLLNMEDDPDHYLQFSFNAEKFRVRFDDIIYIEGMRDKIWICCDGGTYRWKGTMKAMMAQLPDNGFFQVHRSFAVNMDKIKSYNSQFVKVSNDYEVPISKYRLNEFKEAYIRHWSKIL